MDQPSPSKQSSPEVDVVTNAALNHELALGVLALQLKLITPPQLSQVLESWLQEVNRPQSRSLSQRLIEQGYLSADDQRMLQTLVQRHEHQLLSSYVNGTQASADQPLDSFAAARTLQHTLRDSGPGDPPKDVVESFRLGRGNVENLTELNPSNHRFRMLRPYALGGLGIVSIAHDVELNREVAVKEMRLDTASEDAVQRFMLEARVTGQLDHPGIPPVYAIGYFEDGRPFYVMRLIEGVTLKAAAAEFHARYSSSDRSRQRTMQLRKLLGALVSVCNTVHFAHSRGVLHRDLKPSNIMLGGYGETLVLDWGLAKSQAQSMPLSVMETKAQQSKRRTDDPAQTGTGSILGTPHYMSPEQAHGDWDSVNPRSDVYSLGATMYTVLTGKLPFSGKTRDAVLEQVCRGEFKAPRQVDPRIPRELDAICLKAMSLEREGRFATPGDLATEIEHWLADEPVTSYSEPQIRRWQRWVKAHQASVAALVALLATGFVALLIGAVTVSKEHRAAIAQKQQANAERVRATEMADEARKLVFESLVMRFDDQLSSVSGTENRQLELLQDTIGVLEKWALETPYNVQGVLDWAMAIRQRSQMHRSLNQLDDAWSDLVFSLELLDQLDKAPTDLLEGTVAINRIFHWIDLAGLQLERCGSTPQTLEMVNEIQYRAAEMHNLYQHESIVRYAMAEAEVVLARCLADQLRYFEAMETIDRACTRYSNLLHEDSAEFVEAQVYEGRYCLQQSACSAFTLQAHIASLMGDVNYALERADYTEKFCESVLQESSGLKDVGVAQLEIRFLKAQIDTGLTTRQRVLALKT
ncbi:MAG: serine/threonine protein kinase, partial [Pirellulaceae bacterium]|nr:serine/threonine protein kinase [Pirellulaceae bacterium]